MTNFRAALVLENAELAVIQNIVGNHLLGEWPTKYDLLLKISLNTQPLEEMSFKWDFCSRTSALMNLPRLVGSDIQRTA